MFGVIFVVLLCVFNVKTMSLEGTPLTRYTPCGLGLVHFDKTDGGFWQATVNLDLYKHVGNDAVFTIDFQNKVKLSEASNNSTIKVRDAASNFTFHIKGGIPPSFNFTIQLPDDSTEVPAIKKITFNNTTLCDDTIKKSQTIESLNVTKSENYQHVCGRRSLHNTEVSSLRTEAKAGDWPWHVAIKIKSKGGDVRYQCGGSIISRKAVLTAAHCVSNNDIVTEPERIVIVAGIADHSDVNQVGRQTFVVEDVIVHPSYKDVESTSDLAILKISNLQYTEFVQPICVWGPVYDKTNLFGYQATVVGFGRTRDNKPSNVLRSAYTLVQNDSTCINYDSDVYKPLLNEFTFCAGYGPTSVVNPRNGDSGGGLVVPTMQPDHKISWFVRGVLSKCGVAAGETDCSPEFYVVYTDVGPHYGWINHHSGLVYTNNILHENYEYV